MNSREKFGLGLMILGSPNLSLGNTLFITTIGLVLVLAGVYLLFSEN